MGKSLISTRRGQSPTMPHKQAGEQGHVGDQALRLLTFLQREQAWSAEAFLNDWRAMWPSYTDYVDKATKGTLANLAAGATTANQRCAQR